jgi:NAD+ synthase (glutamine-hydrolysing)
MIGAGGVQFCPDMRIALAQINVTVGALAPNAEKILRLSEEARALGAEWVVFPELALCGYPPEDLILKPHFLEDTEAQVRMLAESLPKDLVVLAGAPDVAEGRVYNAAIVWHGGRVAGRAHKMLLPNYGVFDEKRIFAEGASPTLLTQGGRRVAIHICEDSWVPDAPPCSALREAELTAAVNLSASPFHRGKSLDRERILAAAARTVGAPLCYANLVGGQDELVFDGGSMALDAQGRVVARARAFGDDLLLVDVPEREATTPAPEGVRMIALEAPPARPVPPAPMIPRLEPRLEGPAEVYAALKLGLRDYMDKNGFRRCIVALSGGIDSALVAAIAVDALGAGRVAGVTLPSRFSSEATHGDAAELARRLGIEFFDLAIEDAAQVLRARLAGAIPGGLSGLADENLQARVRGILVMALSNHFGWLVLSTGNKSEIATGYSTLYGDMCGGFSLIKDVPKTLVWALARWRNAQGATPPIPPSTIERPPSAELRPNQLDSDALPPYDLLDPILERYVERDWSLERIVADGFDAAMARRVIRLVDLSEYKRRQGAPGVKITPRAFGRDRRMPMTNLYRERT